MALSTTPAGVDFDDEDSLLGEVGDEWRGARAYLESGGRGEHLPCPWPGVLRERRDSEVLQQAPLRQQADGGRGRCCGRNSEAAGALGH